MPLFSPGAACKALRHSVLGGAEKSKKAWPVQVPCGGVEYDAFLAGGQEDHAADVEETASKDVEKEGKQSEIEKLARLDAEDKSRKQNTLTDEDKKMIKLFLMAYGYGGVNWRRIRMMKTKYPLHSAVKHRDTAMITLLLRAGADPSVKNSAGQTPLQLAQQLQEARLIDAFTLS